MNIKAHLRRLLICFALIVAFFVITLLSGDSFANEIGWLVLFMLIMFGVWTLFIWIKNRFGKHGFWIIPMILVVYYLLGTVIVGCFHGWSGLGVALMFLVITIVVAVALFLFIIEILIELLHKKGIVR